jgi:3-dehydroquinate synthase
MARSECVRIEQLLRRARLPIRGPNLGVERYLDLMGHDKKVLAGRLRLVLLRRPGEAVTCADAPQSLIAAAIEACCVEGARPHV